MEDKDIWVKFWRISWADAGRGWQREKVFYPEQAPFPALSHFMCVYVWQIFVSLILLRQDAIEGSSLILLAPKIFTMIISWHLEIVENLTWDLIVTTKKLVEND